MFYERVKSSIATLTVLSLLQLIPEALTSIDESCPTTVTSNLTGYVTSPNYPKNYTRRANCTTTITSDPGFRIKLQFHGQFHIETPCRYDKLKVLEVDPTTSLQTVSMIYCGFKRPDPYTSTHSEIKLWFKSNGSYNYIGFNASYTKIAPVDSTCPTTVTSDLTGYITSPNYPQLYPMDATCATTITADPGTRINLQFHGTFKLETPCVYDNLKIIDMDPATDVEYIQRIHCGSKLPEPYTSSDSKVKIQFKSDYSIQFAGFNVSYTKTGGEDLLLYVCPSSFSEYFQLKHTCYKAGNGLGQSWNDAREWCQNEGADMPVVHDVDTYTHIQRIATLWNLTDVWLGLARPPGKLVFNWVDGNPIIFSDWAADRPRDNYLNLQYRACVKCGASGNRTWQDVDCPTFAKTLCQKRASVIPRCPHGYTFNEVRKTCIKCDKDRRLTWESARMACFDEGGDLVVVPDDASSELIDGLMTDGTTEYWIGLTYSRLAHRMFMLVDGNRLRYRNWAYKSPVVFDYEPSCVAAKAGRLGWSNHMCDERRGFLCENSRQRPLFCLGDNWIKNPMNDKCYKIDTNSKSWNESRQECLAGGGDLATLTDISTKEYVEDLIALNVIHGPLYWIGYRDPNGNDTFEWIDRAALTGSILNEPFAGCGAIKLRKGENSYIEYNCSDVLPFICEKEASKDYPVVGCPHGYTTYMTTTTSRGHITCLMAASLNRTTHSDARQACQSTGGDMCVIDPNDSHKLDFITSNLLAVNQWYWTLNDYPLCSRFAKSVGMENASCALEYFFLCRHRGDVKSMVNMEEIALESNKILVSAENHTDRYESLTEICEYTTFSNMSNSSTWIFTEGVSAIGSVGIDRDFLIKPEDHTQCFETPKEIQTCCFQVILQEGKVWSQTSATMNIEFPAEKALCLCKEVPTTVAPNPTSPLNIENTTWTEVSAANYTIVTSGGISGGNTTFGTTKTTMRTTTETTRKTITANTTETSPPTPPLPPSPPQDPTPMSKENLATLINMTSPQNTNSSKPLNKLCPCRCDFAKFDPNLSSDALSRLLSKIKGELKVDEEKLSKKRSKKISAKDSRTGSKTVGYISVGLCCVPFCIIIGTDLVRLFQYVERKKSRI